MLICWPHDPNPIDAGRELAALGGLAGRRELLDAYLGAGGRQTSALPWYLAMACFKLAIVIEGTWSRFLAGRATRDAGERLHSSATNLIDLGMGVAKGTTLHVTLTRRRRRRVAPPARGPPAR